MSQTLGTQDWRDAAVSLPSMFVGESSAAKDARAFAETATQCTEPVLLLGETGVGKDCLARYIHQKSGGKKPFVKADCGSFSPSLVQAALFGHTRGAFTGAFSAHPGLVRQAEGGLLFMDEVGNLPLELQSILLRLLEEGTFRPIGGTADQAVSVRFVSATNADLEDRVQNGSFRSDLYYRMSVLPFEIPPLRDRRDDIPFLIVNLLGDVEHRFTPAAVDALCDYKWPGNVRELRNVVRRLHVTVKDEITADQVWSCLSKSKTQKAPSASSYGNGEFPTYAQVQREYFERLLRETKGNIKKAAALAGISKKTLHVIIARYGLNAFAARLRLDED